MPYWAAAVPAMRLFVATLESALRPDADIQFPSFLADILQVESFGGWLVPPGRLELPRPCGQQILSLPRLPIPPQGHRVFYLYIKALSNRTGTDGRIRFAPV